MSIAVADTDKLATRDELARSLAWSFYGKGHIYDASVEQVIEHRWREWREQADYILARYAVFHRKRKPPDDPLAAPSMKATEPQSGDRGET